MKLIVQLIFLLCSFSCFSQVEWNEERKSAVMEGVIQVDKVSKQELYERSRIWMATNVTSGNNQTTNERDTITQLIGSGSLIFESSGPKGSKTLNFNIKIYFKDGRLKYLIQNLVLITYPGQINSNNSNMGPTYQDLNLLYEKRFNKKQDKKNFQLLVDEKLTSLVESLKNAVSKTSKSESEGW